MPQLTNEYLLERLKQAFGGAILHNGEPYSLLTVETTRAQIIPVMKFLSEDPELKFTLLTDLCGIHYPEKDSLGVVYHLHSLVHNVRIRLKVFTAVSDPYIPTATVLFASANWMERETYDFFGIIFEGHPDLRRILNVDDMTAFPMRKEFPLEDPNRKDKDDTFFGR